MNTNFALVLRIQVDPSATPQLRKIVKSIEETENEVQVVKSPPAERQADVRENMVGYASISAYELIEAVVTIVGVAGGVAGVADLILSILKKGSSQNPVGNGPIIIVTGNDNVIVTGETKPEELRKVLEGLSVAGSHEAASNHVRSFKREYELKEAHSELQTIEGTITQLNELVATFEKDGPLRFDWQRTRLRGYNSELDSYNKRKNRLEARIRKLLKET